MLVALHYCFPKDRFLLQELAPHAGALRTVAGEHEHGPAITTRPSAGSRSAVACQERIQLIGHLRPAFAGDGHALDVMVAAEAGTPAESPQFGIGRWTQTAAV